MKKVTSKKESPSGIVLYKTKSGGVELRLDGTQETVWATQSQIAEVFGVERSVVTKHIGNVFKNGEVNEKSNVQKMHIATSDKPISIYSLDIILAVGYRTSSARAINFRKWATQTLKQHITRGYTINRATVGKNLQEFIDAVEETKKLLPKEYQALSGQQALDLATLFAHTSYCSSCKN